MDVSDIDVNIAELKVVNVVLHGHVVTSGSIHTGVFAFIGDVHSLSWWIGSVDVRTRDSRAHWLRSEDWELGAANSGVHVVVDIADLAL